MSHVVIGGIAGARPCVRILVLAGVAVSALLVAAAPADAGMTRRPPHKTHKAAKDGVTPIKGPLIIAISIASQRLTVFDNGVPIAHAPVSTGMPGHPTPMGVFSVIQKNKFHRSNIYSGAPMPYMQRITWSGVALHAGMLPGYPASHGCIRLPPDFAVKLWGMTKIGARVVITRHEVTPFAFEHSRLSVLTTRIGEGLSRSGEVRPGVGAGALAAASIAGLKTADASAMTGTSVVDASGRADVAPADTATPVAPAAEPAPAAQAAAPVAPAKVPALEPTAGSAQTTSAELTAASAPPPSGPAGSADEPTPPAGAETTATIKAPVPVLALPVRAAPEPVEAALPTTAALPLDSVFVPPSRPARPLRPGPISVFVSRKEGKLFVRKGFDPLFSVPVTISRPDQPIGTHLFTAAEMKDDIASLRWIAVTMPPEAPKPLESRGQDRGKAGRAAERQPVSRILALSSSSAAEAMDRIELSPETVERISALMSVGASFIISDQGLGYETGLETDFIVLTPETRTTKKVPPRRRPAPSAFSPYWSPYWTFR